ncbi:hypothetical protein BDD12DRAFT_817001 [Trichophaea hybrida]|nr:hypothetical protein BDD12DRAFT_817001 [Trichophaea hybrida]
MELKRLEEEVQRAKEKLGAALTNTRGCKGKQREERGKKVEEECQEKEVLVLDVERSELQRIEQENDNFTSRLAAVESEAVEVKLDLEDVPDPDDLPERAPNRYDFAEVPDPGDLGEPAPDPDDFAETLDPDDFAEVPQAVPYLNEDPEVGTAEETSPECSPFFPSTTNVFVDDSWLDDDWDMMVHRCQYCNRPFGTRTRLQDHLRTWHSDGSPKIPEYKYKPTKSRVRQNNVVVITNGGDMFIEVMKYGYGSWEDIALQYQVSSQVLWIASPVFRSMFGPDSRFKEAVDLRRAHVIGFPPAVISLDDDSTALEFIFNVLHLQHDRIPDKIDFKLMVQVAAICEKYELHKALQPTADRHFKPQKDLSTPHGHEDWLLISYCFGFEDIFTSVSKELILRGKWEPIRGLIFIKTISADSQGKDSESVVDLSPCTPESVTNKLADVRSNQVEQIRKYIENVQAERSHTRDTGRPSHQCKYGGCDFKKCEAMELGYLIQSISQHQLNEDETWNQGLQSISQTLKSIEDIYLTHSHFQCSWVPGFRSIADSSLKFEGLKLSDFPSKSVRRT